MKKITQIIFLPLLLLPVFLMPIFTFAQFNAPVNINPGDPTDPNSYWSADTGTYYGEDSTNSSPDGTYENQDNYTDAKFIATSGASCSVNEKTFRGYVDYIGCVIGTYVFPVMIALALIGFIWGITVMLRNPANEEAQTKGRQTMIWGIIGFFVITSIYALVGIIRRTFGFGYISENDAAPYNQLKDKVKSIK